VWIGLGVFLFHFFKKKKKKIKIIKIKIKNLFVIVQVAAIEVGKVASEEARAVGHADNTA
jgi:hypothetical protein